MKKDDLLTAIGNAKTRSAWERGVVLYAHEFVDKLEQEEITATGGELKELLLNGAKNWATYSWGGCSCIYDCDIAERLCCPSELNRNKHGQLRPNRREEWLDVQARALAQAFRLIWALVIDDNKRKAAR